MLKIIYGKKVKSFYFGILIMGIAIIFNSSAGIPVPEKAVGINLLDKNETREASFCALHERENEAAFMVRTEDYKLILCFNRKEDATTYTKADIIGGEFYDLKKDAKEWNNLFDQPEIKDIKNEMTDLMMAKLSIMSCMVSK